MILPSFDVVLDNDAARVCFDAEEWEGGEVAVQQMAIKLVMPKVQPFLHHLADRRMRDTMLSTVEAALLDARSRDQISYDPITLRWHHNSVDRKHTG